MGSFTLLAETTGISTPGLILAMLAAAAAAGGLVWYLLRRQSQASLEREKADIERELADARRRGEEIVSNAQVEAQKKLLEVMNKFEQETAETREEVKQAEKRLSKREDTLDKKMDVLNTKERKIEELQERIEKEQSEIAERREQINELFEKQKSELQRISKLTFDEAREMYLQRLGRDLEREAGQLVEKVLGDAQEQAQAKARKITIEAIQRFAAENTCEATIATVDVPSDDMKGRIIGREGRNIRAFEKATGANVIVDDTPGVVSISCFDPIRKEIARLTLDSLVRDGRIHPARIEEVVEKMTKQLEEKTREAGKAAILEANVTGLNKKVIEILGRLQYRTSYGQNVLRHSIEVAFLCGIMADELGLDAGLARRCGLLHDIGKALDHDIEGTHTQIGGDFLSRFNEPPEVINAAAGHHGDIAASSVYTPLVTAADAVSASRPGGRRESLERYIERLRDLEKIAFGFEGVNQAYAIEAGREVRVIVDAAHVDDRSSLKLARDIAMQIEQTMTYPGEIKVTVLRELRAVEYAR